METLMQADITVGRYDWAFYADLEAWALPLTVRICPTGNWRAVTIGLLCFWVSVEWWLQDSAYEQRP